MPHRSHLPLAVTYATERDLEALSPEQLAGLLDECHRWFDNMDAFQSAIRTEAGRTEWSVLTRKDVAEATAARERVRNEIDRRHGDLFDQLGAVDVDPIDQR
jgi:hypothetical protein